MAPQALHRTPRPRKLFATAELLTGGVPLRRAPSRCKNNTGAALRHTGSPHPKSTIRATMITRYCDDFTPNVNMLWFKPRLGERLVGKESSRFLKKAAQKFLLCWAAGCVGDKAHGPD